MTDLIVANTIFEQLGGGQFSAMTGVKKKNCNFTVKSPQAKAEIEQAVWVFQSSGLKGLRQFVTDLVWTWKPTVSTYRAFRRTLSQELRARGLTRRALAL